MKYRDQKVKDVPSEKLLFELIKREGKLDAPEKTKRYGLHFESLVGIGKDNTASITLSDDDYNQLESMMANS